MFEVVVGALLVLLSLHYLHSFSSLTGQLLGGLLIASGMLGWVGGKRRSAGLVNLHLLCCVIGIVLALTWIGEVSSAAPGGGRVGQAPRACRKAAPAPC